MVLQLRPDEWAEDRAAGEGMANASLCKEQRPGEDQEPHE